MDAALATYELQYNVFEADEYGNESYNSQGGLFGALIASARWLTNPWRIVRDECGQRWRMRETVWTVREGGVVEWKCRDCGNVLWRWQWAKGE